MRLDRIVTLGLVRPVLAAGIGSTRRALPILMYHGISDDSQPGVSPYYKTTTSRAVFEQHLHRLNEAGFRSVNLGEAVRVLQSGDAQMDRTVAITFDDGFRDFYDLAFPALKQYGHTATMFLPTEFIGNERRSFKGRGCLTWQEARELRSQGIEFGSHTVSHPKLYELSWKEIENELALSKERIELELDAEVTSFAYPFAFPQQDGRFAGKFKKTLRELGYRNCATTIIGRARAGDDVFCLKRLPANVCDDAALLDAKLAGAYDWLALPQGWSKKARGWLRRSPAGRPGLDAAPSPSNSRQTG